MLFPRDSDEALEVVTWVRGTYITEYCFLALAMLVFWDTICTMDKEVSKVSSNFDLANMPGSRFSISG